MEQDFLLEIGSEEIPSSFIPSALNNLQRMARDLFKENRLPCQEIAAMGTPRRLSLFVYGLADTQEDLVQEVTGPPRSVAFDKVGGPTRALEKFCARYGADPEDVSFVQKEKGEYVCLKKIDQGKKTEDLLKEVLPAWILSLSFPKSMRWGDGDIRFARPIQWIVALYGESTLTFTVGDLMSSNTTLGHRFMGDPGPFPIERPGDYQGRLKDNYVILDPDERRSLILEQARKLSREVDGKISEEDELLQTLVYLTEYPVAIRGAFEESFLSLPEEVLIATMKDHQKYFAVKQADGKGLVPYFIAVSNIESPDMALIQKGMERVLKARLEDARFFYNEDTKRPLEGRLDSLKQIVFHKKLGTSYDKVERIRKLAAFLGEHQCPEGLSVISRAAQLCKADLVTEMVGEFPELQGTMGGIYAAHFNEPDDVALTIREHYLPVAAEGDLPSTVFGAVLSLADKMDTVVGFFGIGARVSGTSDQFGLRRRAIGILRIMLEKEIEIPLSAFVKKSSEILGKVLRKDPEEVLRDVIEFFRQRFLPIMLAKGFPHDTIDAVLSREFENVPDLYRRIDILHQMRADPDFEKLIIGCKRADNILSQAEKQFGYQSQTAPFHPDSLEEAAEKNLFSAVMTVKEKIHQHLEEKDYQKVLEELIKIKDPVDRLFDEVLIMVDDESVRDNRLGLLNEVAGLFKGFADFSKIIF